MRKAAAVLRAISRWIIESSKFRMRGEVEMRQPTEGNVGGDGTSCRIGCWDFLVCSIDLATTTRSSWIANGDFDQNGMTDRMFKMR